MDSNGAQMNTNYCFYMRLNRVLQMIVTVVFRYAQKVFSTNGLKWAQILSPFFLRICGYFYKITLRYCNFDVPKLSNKPIFLPVAFK